MKTPATQLICYPAKRSLLLVTFSLFQNMAATSAVTAGADATEMESDEEACSEVEEEEA